VVQEPVIEKNLPRDENVDMENRTMVRTPKKQVKEKELTGSGKKTRP
jgi:hypothetical protein